MLKKSASVILGSSKSSTYRLRFSEVGSAGGVFPFAKIHCTGEWTHGVRLVPPLVSTRLRPSWTAFLSILREHFPGVLHVWTTEDHTSTHCFSGACLAVSGCSNRIA